MHIVHGRFVVKSIEIQPQPQKLKRHQIRMGFSTFFFSGEVTVFGSRGSNSIENHMSDKLHCNIQHKKKNKQILNLFFFFDKITKIFLVVFSGELANYNHKISITSYA